MERISRPRKMTIRSLAWVMRSAPGARGERQHVELDAGDALAHRPVVGHEGGHDHAQRDHAPTRRSRSRRGRWRGRSVVVAPLRDDAAPLEVRDHERRDAGEDDTRRRHRERDLASRERGRDDERERGAEEDQHRQDRQVVDRGDHEVHLFTPAGATCSISWCTEGVMRSSTGLGKTPSTTMSTTTGTRTHCSLGVASAIVALGPSASPWKTRW